MYSKFKIWTQLTYLFISNQNVTILIFRTCSGLKRVYILIREKKGKTTEERFKELFDDPVSKLTMINNN